MNEKKWCPIEDQEKYLAKLERVSRRERFPSTSFFFILDDVKDIDEIRTGFQAPTFHRLVQRGILRSNDVNIRTFHRLAR